MRDQVTVGTNRIRNLLLSVHPALKRALGPNLAHHAVLALLARCGGPTGLTTAGRKRIDTVPAKKAPRMHAALAERPWAAIGEQTVVVAGTTAVEAILAKQAAALAGLLDQRAAIAVQVEKVLDDRPLAQVLMSMPGVGVRTGARILVEVGDASSFPSAAYLAVYAGLAPVTHRSGSSIKGEHPRARREQTVEEGPVPVRIRRAVRPRMAGPTATANAKQARNTAPPPSAWPDAAPTSSTPWSETQPTTRRKPLSGILVIGSGFLTHGPPFITADMVQGAVPAWSRDFDDWVSDALAPADLDELAVYRDRHRDCPTRTQDGGACTPLFVMLGAGGDTVTTVIDGYWWGLSSRSLRVACSVRGLNGLAHRGRHKNRASVLEHQL